MPVSLRRQKYCHYCGKRTAQPHLRTFTCNNCEAVNHLDKNGDITDPPAASTTTTTQYAEPQPFHVDSVFCRTCVKNQNIVARLLADFVPDETDPGHQSALRGLPAYRDRLNQDYPQCCSECEPRARSRMNAATKAAASDNMRRQVQRSKTKKVVSIIDWRIAFIELARCGYCASIFIQLLWHYFGAQGSSTTEYRGPMHCLSEWPASVVCKQTMASFLPHSILMAFMCLWWNPGWHQKLKSREGRLVGLAQFYTVQTVIVALRVGVAMLLSDVELDERQRTMGHGLSLIGLTILTGFGLCLVTLDTTPRINWGYEPPRLVSNSQFVPLPLQDAQSFPLEKLAPVSRPNFEPWRPPTPPIEDDDAMDWTPSQTFRPQRQQTREFVPSPFHGKLPALPGGLRRPEPKQSIGLPPGFFDRRDVLPPRRAESNSASLAEPRFFPTGVDTGLEKMFEQVFSLGSAASEPARSGQVRSPATQEKVFDKLCQDRLVVSRSTRDFVALFSSIFALLLLSLWLISDRLSIALPHLKQAILVCSGLMPSITVINNGPTSSPLSVAELAGTLVLLAVSQALPEEILHRIGLLVLVQSLFRGLCLILLPKAAYAVTHTREATDIVKDQPHGPAMDYGELNSISGPGPLRRKVSADTILSEASNATASTHEDWKTPQASRNTAFMDAQSLSISGLGLGSANSTRGRRYRGI